MRRFVLPDTSLLIALYNEGSFVTEYTEVVQKHIIRYSSVVLNEFLRGAHDPVSRKIAHELLQLSALKVVTPLERHWIRCGEISQKILRGKRKTRQEIGLLQNDILIALSVRDLGGTLLTLDNKDFSLVQKYVPFDCVIWSSPS